MKNIGFFINLWYLLDLITEGNRKVTRILYFTQRNKRFYYGSE